MLTSTLKSVFCEAEVLLLRMCQSLYSCALLSSSPYWSKSAELYKIGLAAQLLCLSQIFLLCNLVLFADLKSTGLVFSDLISYCLLTSFPITVSFNYLFLLLKHLWKILQTMSWIRAKSTNWSRLIFCMVFRGNVLLGNYLNLTFLFKGKKSKYLLSQESKNLRGKKKHC